MLLLGLGHVGNVNGRVVALFLREVIAMGDIGRDKSALLAVLEERGICEVVIDG